MSTNNKAARAAQLLRLGDNYSDEDRNRLLNDIEQSITTFIDRSAAEFVDDAKALLSSLDLAPETRTKATAVAAIFLLDEAGQEITALQQQVYDAQNVAAQAQLDAQDARHEAEVQKHAATARRELTVAWNDYTDAITTGATPVNPRPRRGAFTEDCRYLVKMNDTGVLRIVRRGPNDADGNATWFTDADKDHRKPLPGDLTVLAYLRTAEDIAARQAEDADDYEDDGDDAPGMDWPTVRTTVLGDLDNTIEDHRDGRLDDEELDERLDTIYLTLESCSYTPQTVAESAARLSAQHTRRNYTDTELQAGMRDLRALVLTDGKIDLTEEES